METNKIYVAIGKEVEERKSTLKWVLKAFTRMTICVIYVHVPAKIVPLPSGLKLHARLVKKNELERFRAQEREEMLQLVDDCSKLCAVYRVPCENTFVEKDSITEGILELICQLRIENLVMGAAVNYKYSWGMTKLVSEKAKNVLRSAPDYCHIWFICNEHLIFKREGVMQQSRNVVEMPANSSEINNQSDGIPLSQVSETRLRNTEPSGYERNPTKAYRSSTFTGLRSSLAKTRVSNAKPVSSSDKEGVSTQHGVEFSDTSESCDQHLRPSSPSQGSNTNDSLYNNLEPDVSEAEKSWREAFKKSVSYWNAEKQAMEAIRKAKHVERLSHEELRLKKLIKGETESTKNNFTKESFELSEALGHKLSVTTEIEKLNLKVKELEDELFSAAKMSEKCKNERDKLQIERDSAAGVAQELREQLDKGSSSSLDPLFSEISYLELQKATNYFDPSLKIGKGSYGSMYKGNLHYTEVAIKLLAPNSMENHEEFIEQVICISKLQHPNLVTFMGACQDPWALVYEYLPGGSLMDRLARRDDGTPPLTRQMRIRIAMDIYSTLMFLHSSKPTCIAQDDLTLVKLLLDANLTCKITDFGVVSKETVSENSIATRLFKPEPDNYKSANIGSDFYYFGIIVLQLLTGNSGKLAALDLANEVKYALSRGAIDSLLDPLAGDWPFVQAEQLAHMALMCCDVDTDKQPDLASDVWRVLEPMRTSCPSFLLSVAFHDQPPHYFICPILQETMEDPHFAADGFTYEAEAIRGWFESGHDTSPMTNVKLSNLNLTPNHALRSVIQEWLQLTSTK